MNDENENYKNEYYLSDSDDYDVGNSEFNNSIPNFINNM